MNNNKRTLKEIGADLMIALIKGLWTGISVGITLWFWFKVIFRIAEILGY